MFQSTAEMDCRAIYMHSVLPWNFAINQIVSDYENDLRGPVEFRKILVRDANRNVSGRLVIANVSYTGPEHPGRYLATMNEAGIHNRIIATFISDQDNVRYPKSTSWAEQDYCLWDFMMGDEFSSYGDHFSHIQPTIHATGTVSSSVCNCISESMQMKRMLTLVGQDAADLAKFRMSAGRLTNVADHEPERDTYDMCVPESVIYCDSHVIRIVLSETIGEAPGRIAFLYLGVQKVSGENIVYQKPDFGIDQNVTRFANVKIGPDMHISAAIRGWMIIMLEAQTAGKKCKCLLYPDNNLARRCYGPNVWSYIIGMNIAEIDGFLKSLVTKFGESMITLSIPEINVQLRHSIKNLLNPILNDYAHSMSDYLRIWTR